MLIDCRARPCACAHACLSGVGLNDSQKVSAAKVSLYQRHYVAGLPLDSSSVLPRHKMDLLLCLYRKGRRSKGRDVHRMRSAWQGKNKRQRYALQKKGTNRLVFLFGISTQHCVLPLHVHHFPHYHQI